MSLAHSWVMCFPAVVLYLNWIKIYFNTIVILEKILTFMRHSIYEYKKSGYKCQSVYAKAVFYPLHSLKSLLNVSWVTPLTQDTISIRGCKITNRWHRWSSWQRRGTISQVRSLKETSSKYGREINVKKKTKKKTCDEQ